MRDVGTLLEALPYIREFHGKTVVIKYGGAAMEDPALREEFARDVVLLKYVGLNLIVVHGGGPEITAYMKRLSMPVEFVGGLRVSDADTVEVAKMVLIGKVNKDIVLRLNRHGQSAVGLSGDDGGLFRVVRQAAPDGTDVGFVGSIERVDRRVLDHVAQDYIPVIASIGADRESNLYNINADEGRRCRRARPGRLQGHVPHGRHGLAARPSDPESVISEAGADEVEAVLGQVAGGMRPKLAACLDAIHGGVSFAHIVDGRVPTRCCSSCSPTRASARRSGRQRERLTLDELRALEREHVVPAYARLPAALCGEERGRGTPTGAEYLDFQTGLAVSSVGHPPARRRGDPHAGGEPRPRRQPLLHSSWRDAPGRAAGRASSWAARSTSPTRDRGGGGGAEGRAQGAISVATSSRCSAPTADVRVAVGHAAGEQAGAVRPAGCRWLPARWRRPPRPSRAPWAPGLRPCCSSPCRARAACTCWATTSCARRARPATSTARR